MIKENKFLEKMCLNSGVISGISFLLAIISIYFSHFNYQGILACLIFGSVNYILMMRSWRYPNSWAILFSIMITIILVNYNNIEGGTISDEILDSLQKLGAFFGATFLILRIKRNDVLIWARR